MRIYNQTEEQRRNEFLRLYEELSPINRVYILLYVFWLITKQRARALLREKGLLALAAIALLLLIITFTRVIH